jgi:MscS family membrane protein
MESVLYYLTTVTIAGNELWRVTSLFFIVLAGFIIGRIARHLLLGIGERIRRLGREMPADTFEALARAAGFICFAASLRIGLLFVLLPDRLLEFVGTITDVLVALAIGYTAYCLVDVLDKGMHRRFPNGSRMGAMLIPLVRKSIRVTVVILTILQVATILSDKPVTSLLAGLGVGGLAVALAAQETIKNFFGSLVLFGDRPFEINDRVVVDGHDGNVTEVGFRSTRIRTLQGNLVTIPNGELANKTILNIGQRPHIQRNFVLSLTYDTPPAKVKRAMEIVLEVLRDHEGRKPDFPPRVWFEGFGASSLDLRVLYWYHPPDWWAYCAFGDRVNMQILERFNAEGISFAFPTQTLYLARDTKRGPGGA